MSDARIMTGSDWIGRLLSLTFVKRRLLTVRRFLGTRLLDRDEFYYQRRQHEASLAPGYSLKPFEKHRCLFIHIPKTAGLSVNTTLFDCYGGAHRTAEEYATLFGEEDFESFFKFTFVRNPWDRLVSAYTFLQKGGINRDDAAFADEILQKHRTFDDFVLNWLSRETIWEQKHFMPQYHFICREYPTVSVDFLGRFESIADDFRHIAQRLHLNKQLAHVNSSKRRPYQAYYNPRTIEKVQEVYREDVEITGYEFQAE